MVLLYPQPTIFTKHYSVPITANGEKLGDLLTTNEDLQKYAVEYGLRNRNTTYWQDFVNQHKLPIPQNLIDVIEPPSYEILEKNDHAHRATLYRNANCCQPAHTKFKSSIITLFKITFLETNAMSDILTPPETLVAPEPLTPPAVVQPVQLEKAEGMMPIENAVKANLIAKSPSLSTLLSIIHCTALPLKKRYAVHNMGNAEIRASASASNRMLERPVKAMEYGLLDDKSFVAKSLTDLRKPSKTRPGTPG